MNSAVDEFSCQPKAAVFGVVSNKGKPTHCPGSPWTLTCEGSKRQKRSKGLKKKSATAPASPSLSAARRAALVGVTSVFVLSFVLAAAQRERCGTHKAIGRGYLLLADYDSQLIRRENQFVSPPKVKSCEKAKGKRDRH